MNKRLTNLISVLLLTLVILGASTSVAHAGLLEKIVDFESLVANIMNTLMSGMGWVLAISGSLLNFSINLTLHIRDFVNSTPAIYTTWKAIRDISGMFIIFFLLYAAIRMILGKDAGFGTLIKNIVIAGVLINFSFFFASLGIDASNIVSVQLYNAIAPQNTLAPGAVTDSLNVRLADGGLSNIFMQSLKLQTINDVKGAGTGDVLVDADGNEVSETTKIFLAGIVSIMIMLIAAISFAAAALAFVIRFVVLLMLLAFSPIWFAAHIVPEVQQYSKKWLDSYKSMLLFMPVYLLLMYLALNVLTTTPLLDGNNVGAAAGIGGFITLAVNATIIIILINMPLLAAMKIAGEATNFINTKKLGAANLFKGLGNQAKGFGSQVGSRTIGRAAFAAANSSAVKSFAASAPAIGGFVQNKISKVGSAGFGGGKDVAYDARLKKKSKAEEEMHKKIGEFDKSKYDNTKKIDYTDKDGKIVQKTAREIAEIEAKNRQEKYRSNLPWKAGLISPGWGSGLLGFAIDNRANRQTALKLEGEAKKEQKKTKTEENKKLKKDNNKLIADLESQMPSGDPKDPNWGMGSEAKRKELTDKINALKNANRNLDEDIDEPSISDVLDGLGKTSKDIESLKEKGS